MMDRNKIARIIALGTSIVIALQIVLILIRGSGVCFNDACKIVEEYTTITPLGLNLIGFLFFQALFWSLWWHDTRQAESHNWPNLLLLAGLAAETVLFSFQLYVVRSFCAYCLLIFAAILVLNLLRGRRQVLAGATLTLAILIGFSVLSFNPTMVSSQTFTLERGIYGTRTCAQPTKKIYLIFSEECPHCLKVVEALNNCNSCELHLNPIDQIETLHFDGVDLTATYSPQINRLILSMFGIQEIPVLLVDNQGDFSFIKGENKIIDYITHACFTQSPTL
ncbi:MAG: hypothetical protein WBG37_14065, partial [Desulfobacterales bacterium]